MMFDIHNHVLAGIDDGAADDAASLALLHNALAQKLTHLVATPHFNNSSYAVTIGVIEQAGQRLQSLINQHQLPLKLALSGEVRFNDELINKLKQQQVPMIGQWQGKPALLLELPYRLYPAGIERFTAWLFKQGIFPILAHPERFDYFLQQPNKLQPLLKQGCGVQITADSLLSNRGSPTQTFAESILLEARVGFIASDAHHASSRPFANDTIFGRSFGRIQAVQLDQWLIHNPRELSECLFQNPTRCYRG